MRKTLMTITVTALLLCPFTDAAVKAEASKTPPLKPIQPDKITTKFPVSKVNSDRYSLNQVGITFTQAKPVQNQAKTPVKSANKPESKKSVKWSQTGQASWYGSAFNGHKTASGEPYDMSQFTAAHLTLPINTWVRVTNLHNKRSILVRINDRGPYVGSRVLDLSSAAAAALGFRENGIAKVKIETADFETMAVVFAPTALF